MAKYRENISESGDWRTIILMSVAAIVGEISIRVVANRRLNMLRRCRSSSSCWAIDDGDIGEISHCLNNTAIKVVLLYKSYLTLCYRTCWQYVMKSHWQIIQMYMINAIALWAWNAFASSWNFERGRANRAESSPDSWGKWSRNHISMRNQYQVSSGS